MKTPYQVVEKSVIAVRRRLAGSHLDSLVRLLGPGHRLPTFRLESGGLTQGAGIFMCHGACRMFEPTRVLVIAMLLVLANLEHTEHAAHLDRAKRPFASHHGYRVVRYRHFQDRK